MAFVESIDKLLNLHCREAAALLSKAQDGELSRVDRWALRLHLLICAPCRRYRRQLHKLGHLLDGIVKRLEGDGRLPGVRLSDEARRRLSELIESGSG
jgi:hypothetical protein